MNEQLEGIFREQDCGDFRWIDPQQIIVAQWVRMKCTFGCDSYGKKAACPPNTPAVDACRQFFQEYHTAAIFHFAAAKPERDERERWLREINARMLKLERAAFLAGYQKAFGIPAACCRLCAKCEGEHEECKHLESARPTAEALAVDVYGTARGAGYHIQVLTDPKQEMDRYALLMLD